MRLPSLPEKAKWVGSSDLEYAEVHVRVPRSLSNLWILMFGGRNARFTGRVVSSSAKGRSIGDTAQVDRRGDVTFS